MVQPGSEANLNDTLEALIDRHGLAIVLDTIAVTIKQSISATPGRMPILHGRGHGPPSASRTYRRF